MQSALYVSLSGQVAAEKRLTSVANNVANISTVGFRAEEVRFEEVLSKEAGGVSFVAPGETYISRNAGGLKHTGNSLDVAVQGDAFFSVMTPAGVAYTRDGRMHLNVDGQLTTAGGHQVLDGGGAPIGIGNEPGEITIGRDGAITRNNIQIGAIGIFELPAGSKLTRYGGSAVLSDVPGVAIQQTFQPGNPAGNQPGRQFGVMQGYVEDSNVNPMLEMTKMISLQRNFDSSVTTTREMEDTTMSAIRALGPSS